MPTKIQMRDLVILLPGITGSVLQKDGRDLWAISGRAIWSALRSLGGSLDALRMESDDPDADDLGDGIRAARLIDDAHIVPGLVKIDGYSTLSSMIKEEFEVEEGSLDDERPGNYFEFPYDWRRDNRASARALHRLIVDRLPRWREHSNATDAKAVRKNNFSNGAGAITDRTLEKQAFLIIPEGVAEVIFAHRLR